MHSSILYDTAREYPEIRQEFLDGFDCEDAAPLIDSLRYIPEDQRTQAGDSLLVGMGNPKGWQRKRYPMAVFPAAFVRYETVHDFASSIIDFHGEIARVLRAEPMLNPARPMPEGPMEERIFRFIETRDAVAEEQLLWRTSIQQSLRTRGLTKQLESDRPISLAYREEIDHALRLAQHQQALSAQLLERVRDERYDKIIGAVGHLMLSGKQI